MKISSDGFVDVQLLLSAQYRAVLITLQHLVHRVYSGQSSSGYSQRRPYQFSQTLWAVEMQIRLRGVNESSRNDLSRNQRRNVRPYVTYLLVAALLLELVKVVCSCIDPRHECRHDGHNAQRMVGMHMSDEYPRDI